MDVRLEVTRQNRKTVRMDVQAPDRVLLRVPLSMPEGKIREFLDKNASWIEKHLALERERAAAAPSPYTPEDIRRLADEAVRVIPERVKYYAPIVGVTCGRITVRNQKTKWGSCSARGNLNFNCLLMEAPPEVLDYVVVHELCHRNHMDHSPAFWAEVARVLPDYRKQKQWLKENGPGLIRRMTGA